MPAISLHALFSHQTVFSAMSTSRLISLFTAWPCLRFACSSPSHRKPMQNAKRPLWTSLLHMQAQVMRPQRTHAQIICSSTVHQRRVTQRLLRGDLPRLVPSAAASVARSENIAPPPPPTTARCWSETALGHGRLIYPFPLPSSNCARLLPPVSASALTHRVLQSIGSTEVSSGRVYDESAGRGGWKNTVIHCVAID
ncbi:hypothetical protein CALVIDRAFT_182135 [Calocera viscosa TUFC12733]|uniref:Uncharacterized protein n=1 Tax=Calocera viscosa (strain TUFC12733) TaxID=1330018 RepID=A0A167L0U7_CALVF|nr:hypothetical protein CALVIDRAFT_182135 [Calocera viscosa TUFC12733]